MKISSDVFIKKFLVPKILLSLFILVCCSCSSLMYYPLKQQLYAPEKYKLNYENVYFENKDKQRLHAWWFPARTKESKGTFIFFHGNAENLSSHFLSLGWLPEKGYNYFIFDYPGYGQSQGDPSPYANVISGVAAVQWVQQNKDQRPLIIYGQSMGGIVALRTVNELKNQVPIKAVVADGTFLSFQSIGRQKLSEHWTTWLFQPLAYLLLSDRWAPEVKNISPLPLIVIHGNQDAVIPFKNGEKIFTEANDPKVFIPVPQGHHGDLFWVEGQRYRDIVLEKIEKGI